MFESCAAAHVVLEVAASQTEAPSLKSPVATHAQPLARLQPGVRHRGTVDVMRESPPRTRAIARRARDSSWLSPRPRIQTCTEGADSAATRCSTTLPRPIRPALNTRKEAAGDVLRIPRKFCPRRAYDEPAFTPRPCRASRPSGGSCSRSSTFWGVRRQRRRASPSSERRR